MAETISNPNIGWAAIISGITTAIPSMASSPPSLLDRCSGRWHSQLESHDTKDGKPAMRWVLIPLAIAVCICIAVYLITGFGWEIGGPITAALAGFCWLLSAMNKAEK